MANELFACTGSPSAVATGNQNLGRAVIGLQGVKSGGTHYKTYTARAFTVSVATYTATWTDRFDDPRYYSGDGDT